MALLVVAVREPRDDEERDPAESRADTDDRIEACVARSTRQVRLSASTARPTARTIGSNRICDRVDGKGRVDVLRNASWNATCCGVEWGLKRLDLLCEDLDLVLRDVANVDSPKLVSILWTGVG